PPSSACQNTAFEAAISILQIDPRSVGAPTVVSASETSNGVPLRASSIPLLELFLGPQPGSAAFEGTAAADDREVPLSPLEERLEAVALFKSKRGEGTLDVSLVGPYEWAAEVNACVEWRGHEAWPGISTIEDHIKGFVRPQHAAFHLYHKKKYLKRRRKHAYAAYDENCRDSVMFDPESSPQYANLNPGTVTVEGFALECWEYEDLFGSPRDRTNLVSTSKVNISAQRLLRRLDELQRETGNFSWTREEDYLNLRDVLQSSTLWVDPSRARNPTSQITDLFKMLNRSDISTDFIVTAAISPAAWGGVENMWDFLLQIVLGQELGRRMQDHPDASIAGFTPRILATLIISDLWARNVRMIKTPTPAPEQFTKKPKSIEDEAKAELLKEQGNRALKVKNYLEAANSYTEALKIGGSNAVYICNRSAAYTYLGKHDGALLDAWIAKELDPTYAKAWARLGAALLRAGDLDSAVEAYETAVQLAGEGVTRTMKIGLEEARTKVQDFNTRFKQAEEKRKHEMRVNVLDKKWNLLTNEIKFHSHVHEIQVDGLLQFAEKMQWPYLTGVRDKAEEAYSAIHRGQPVNAIVTDWLFGLTLPGEHFAFKIMWTLINCSPTISATLGLPFHIDNNVILQEQSYWRVRSVLGRVLGPLPKVRSVGGWLGPCPPVEISPPGEGSFEPLLVRLKARQIPPRRPIDVSNDGTYVGGRESYSCTGPSADEDINAYIVDMTSEEAYVAPQPPIRCLSRITLTAVRLERLLSERVGTNKARREDGQEADYRASLVFYIDNNEAPVTYTLYTNPIFVTLPACCGGPHEVHRRDLERFQNEPWEAERLKEYVAGDAEEDDRACMVINATGAGAEVLARAWCSERIHVTKPACIKKSGMSLNTHNGRANPMEVTVENSEMESTEEMEGPRNRNGRSYDGKGPVNVHIANDSTIRYSNGSPKVEEVVTPIHPGQERGGGQTSLGCGVSADRELEGDCWSDQSTPLDASLTRGHSTANPTSPSISLRSQDDTIDDGNDSGSGILRAGWRGDPVRTTTKSVPSVATAEATACASPEVRDPSSSSEHSSSVKSQGSENASMGHTMTDLADTILMVDATSFSASEHTPAQISTSRSAQSRASGEDDKQITALNLPSSKQGFHAAFDKPATAIKRKTLGPSSGVEALLALPEPCHTGSVVSPASPATMPAAEVTLKVTTGSRTSPSLTCSPPVNSEASIQGRLDSQEDTSAVHPATNSNDVFSDISYVADFRPQDVVIPDIVPLDTLWSVSRCGEDPPSVTPPLSATLQGSMLVSPELPLGGSTAQSRTHKARSSPPSEDVVSPGLRKSHSFTASPMRGPSLREKTDMGQTRLDDVI
ncbi:hypothetical protein LTR56_027486, partial [Elasticomyces elasticus]